jgi:hypothetical protein
MIPMATAELILLRMAIFSTMTSVVSSQRFWLQPPHYTNKDSLGEMIVSLKNTYIDAGVDQTPKSHQHDKKRENQSTHKKRLLPFVVLVVAKGLQRSIQMASII